MAIVLGVLITLGARRIRPEPLLVELDSAADHDAAAEHDVTAEQDATAEHDVTDDHDLAVDLGAAEREADAPAERMAVELERLRSTAPPVARRRGRP